MGVRGDHAWHSQALPTLLDTWDKDSSAVGTAVMPFPIPSNASAWHSFPSGHGVSGPVAHGWSTHRSLGTAYNLGLTPSILGSFWEKGNRQILFHCSYQWDFCFVGEEWYPASVSWRDEIELLSCTLKEQGDSTQLLLFQMLRLGMLSQARRPGDWFICVFIYLDNWLVCAPKKALAGSETRLEVHLFFKVAVDS